MSTPSSCARCSHPRDPGDRFCPNCGAARTASTPGLGAVEDGVWERGEGEVARRVDPEEARTFLGQRVVCVPEGAIGVILVHGVVERILPPGERTAVSLFERVVDFFRGGVPRTAFYLVDLRPVAVPFRIEGRPDAAGGRTVTQLLATFRVPRGDRAALGVFLDAVVGPRTALSTRELHDLVRADVARLAEGTLERLAAEGLALASAEAEARLREGLAAFFPLRFGLHADVSVAPLTAIRTLSWTLGVGPSPRTRACAGCRRELPLALRFCDACGAPQPTVPTQSGPLDATTPLFSADGEALELDLTLRVAASGLPAPGVAGPSDTGDLLTRLAPALVGATANLLAAQDFAQLASGDGFARAEEALRTALATPAGAFGLTLLEVALVDVRRKHGAWLLGARADLLRAEADLTLGREALGVREGELELEALTLAQALRLQRLSRDHALDAAFARDAAAMADRQRREGLAVEAVALEVAAAQRDARVREARDALARAEGRARAEADREDARVDATFGREQDRARFDHQIALEAERRRRQVELDDAARRSDIDLAAYAEARQMEKLRAMTELDRQLAEDEHRQALEKRAQLQGLSPEAAIALQAAELAKSGHGDAWAEALAARAKADVEARHQETLARLQQAAMEAMGKVAASRAEAAPLIAGPAPVVTTVSTTASESASRPCKACGAGIRPDAHFCGGCGATQG